MLKSKKFALIILTLAIVFATICLFAVLFISANKNSNLTDAEISNKIQEEPTNTVVSPKTYQGKEESDDAKSYTGGISVHDNKAYCKVYIRYDDTYISSVSISNVDAWADYNSRGYHWDDAVFYLNPQAGYEWIDGLNSYNFYVRRSSSDAAWDNPPGCSSSEYESSYQTFSRSGNQFLNGGWSDSGSGLKGTIQQTFYIDTTGCYLFKNWWTTQPYVSGCDYGQTPTWGGAALHGSTTVYWYNSSQSWLSSKPTMPGTYYARVTTTGTGNAQSLDSGYMPFTITGSVAEGSNVAHGNYEYKIFGMTLYHKEAYLKVDVMYDTAYVSDCSITGMSAENSNPPIVKWDSPAFVLTPRSGLSWAASGFSLPVYAYGPAKNSTGSSFFQTPSTLASSVSPTSTTFSLSGNTLTAASPYSYSGSGNNTTYYSAIYIPIGNVKLFNNSWAVNPSIASWTYGGTASDPQGVANYSGTTTYAYYDVNQNQLSSKPTTPGTYYMRCYDSGVGMVNGITSDYIQFKIYAPTPSISPINQMWTGSTLSVTPSYNTTYINAPSGTTGTNIGSYTASFTTKSGYVFNNNSTTYNITWHINKRVVAIPAVSGSYTYDGTSKNAVVEYFESAYVTQSGTASATNANTYTLTFTLKTPYTNGGTSGCVWEEGSGGSTNDTSAKTGTWTINRNPCAIKPTLKDSGSYTYTGSAININTHVNNFNTSYMTASNNSKTNAGSYTTTYTLNSNYAWQDGTTANTTVSWSITPKPLTKPTRSANPTFTGSAVSPTLSNFDSNTMNKTGDTSATNVKTSGNYTITISLKDTANYKWSDNTTASYTITWNVLPKDISGGTITITPTDYTYDGAEHKPTVTVTVP